MTWLLDTHTLLWMATDTARLSEPFLLRLTSDTPPLKVSAATAWELAIKVNAGKLRLPKGVDDLWDYCGRNFGIEELAITRRYAIAAAELPLFHKDPFDRVLAATALIEDLTIVTVDQIFSRYGCKVIDPTA